MQKAFHITGPWWNSYTGCGETPSQRASNVKRWYFLCCWAVEQSVRLVVIWDSITLIWRHYYVLMFTCAVLQEYHDMCHNMLINFFVHLKRCWLYHCVFPIMKTSVFSLCSDGLVQERCKSSALAMELHLSCTNPSIYIITISFIWIWIWLECIE